MLYGLGEFGLIVLIRDFFATSEVGNVKPSLVRQYMRGVAYLDSHARARYRVDAANGLLTKGGKPFDTSGMRTCFSGQGRAIFVQSPPGVFYSGNHVAGQFHHSSFLSGHPVRAAGEWKVQNGQLKVITAKSGHYKPQLSQFTAALWTLKQAGALGKARAHVFKNGESTHPYASDFIVRAGGYTVWKQGR